ncbi:MAG: FAD:protein FMN transferase [Deltaproteobacteria bacterium]|nr:FAD:protein FMN transferase [Deltaproteobacteria bacterium]
MIRITPLALVMTSLVVSARAEPPPEREWARAGFTSMATRIDVVLPPDAPIEAAMGAVKAVFAEVERTANEWQDGSPLAAVNARAGGEAVVVPPDLLALVQRSVAVGRLTDGAFDPTWAALWGTWRFKGEGLVVPPADLIAARRRLIDYRRVEIDAARGTLRLPEAGMKLGLGGIAKGHALDLAAARLRALGVTRFLLSAGGQVYAAGDHDGRPWRVGLRDPRGLPDDSFATLEVRDASVSTSGDYERFFVADGVRHHHILDPRTGYPSRGARAATVICDDATLADALSTALMVLGPEAGLAVIARVAASEGRVIEAVVVDAAGRVHTTPGMRSRLVVVHPPIP